MRREGKKCSLGLPVNSIVQVHRYMPAIQARQRASLPSKSAHGGHDSSARLEGGRAAQGGQTLAAFSLGKYGGSLQRFSQDARAGCR